MSRIHFIAIGGSTMHNLAIALHRQGHVISGSDDEIFEPAKNKLLKHNLFPEETGWFPEKLNNEIDTIILGMHARVDNPELMRAKALGLKIYSYPEYIYEQSIDKQRIVIAGSHGKTTITAIIMHVLNKINRKFDYLIGAEVEGFDVMVRLTDDAPVIIIEGDEYLASPIRRQPKFMFYHHHIGLISGLAWDHVNIYSTFEEYVKSFEIFADSTPKSGILIFDSNDDLVSVIGKKERADVTDVEYSIHPHEIQEGKSFLKSDFGKIPIQIFGNHNMRNISGAKTVLNKIGITDEQFYKEISSFNGIKRRLEQVGENFNTAIYRDFAHAPSKLAATLDALKNQFPDRGLIACLELHTFSSLNKKFIKEYQGTFNVPDISIVYYNPNGASVKKIEILSDDEIKKAFKRPDLKIFTEKSQMIQFLKDQNWENKNLVMMSSGNFDNLNMTEITQGILIKN